MLTHQVVIMSSLQNYYLVVKLYNCSLGFWCWLWL